MFFFKFASKLSLLITILTSCHANDTQNIVQQKIALFTGRQARFPCQTEIKVHQQTCQYNINAKAIEVHTTRECELTFTCNETLYTVECCFVSTADREITTTGQLAIYSEASDKVQVSTDEVARKNMSDGSVLSSLYDLRSNLFDFKAEKGLKMLLLIIAIFLMIIICSIIPCKLWITFSLLRKKSYKAFNDEKTTKPKVKDTKNEKNLINLDQEKDDKIHGSDIECFIDVPLKV